MVSGPAAHALWYSAFAAADAESHARAHLLYLRWQESGSSEETSRTELLDCALHLGCLAWCEIQTDVSSFGEENCSPLPPLAPDSQAVLMREIVEKVGVESGSQPELITF